MWHAEIIIETRKDLPPDVQALLRQRVSQNMNHAAVLQETVHRNSRFLNQSIVCSFRDQTSVFFVTMSDVRTFTVHIERTDKRLPVRELKVSVLQVIRRLESFLKHHGNGVRRIDGEVFAAENKEMVCTSHTFVDRLKKSLLSNLPSKIYIPVATVVASYSLDAHLERSLFNAVVALVALGIWVVIEALRSEPYVFSEV